MMSSLSYRERATFTPSLLAQHILTRMDEKKTNLTLSVDVTTASELLEYADALGEQIIVLKTHIDILSDFSPKLIESLTKLANKRQFFIFEDRKFADIGNTVKLQHQGGIYRIADWAHLVNAHALPGRYIIDGLSSPSHSRGILLIAEMSCEGHLLDEAYQQKTLDIANLYPEKVIGFITQRTLSTDPKWINWTPGIQLEPSRDNLGQRYRTPIEAMETGTDSIIVGRGIIHAADPVAMAKYYREESFHAYRQRIGK